MTSARIQLRGNCQLCGRKQAVTGGFVAKHGYEVKDGYFRGVCAGHNFRPMQVERTETDSQITRIRADAVRSEQKAEAFRSGRIVPSMVQGSWNSQTRAYDQIPFADAPSWTQADAVKMAVWNATRHAEIARRCADDIEALVNEVHGKPLTSVAVEAASAPIAKGETRIGEKGRVYVARYQEKARIYWTHTNEAGQVFKGWTGSAAWRRMELQATPMEAN